MRLLKRLTALPVFFIIVVFWNAEAAPVKTVGPPDKLTKITIADKTTGEKLYMNGNRIIYTRKGKIIWTEKSSPDDLYYRDVIIDQDGIYLSLNKYADNSNDGVEIRKYDKEGNISWTSTNGDLHLDFVDIPQNSDYLFLTGLTSGAKLFTTSYKISRLTGSISESFYDPLAYNEGLFLISADDPNKDYNDLTIYQEEVEKRTEAGFSVVRIDGAVVSGRLDTPARIDCGALKVVSPIPPDGSDIRGDYLYARRVDDCGKFTYRFHWTDPTNPPPEILIGWH